MGREGRCGPAPSGAMSTPRGDPNPGVAAAEEEAARARASGPSRGGLCGARSPRPAIPGLARNPAAGAAGKGRARGGGREEGTCHTLLCFHQSLGAGGWRPSKCLHNNNNKKIQGLGQRAQKLNHKQNKTPGSVWGSISHMGKGHQARQGRDNR